MEQEDTALEREVAVAYHRAGDEDRQEAAAAQVGRQAESEQAAGGHQHRVHARCLQPDAVEQAHRTPAHAQPDSSEVRRVGKERRTSSCTLDDNYDKYEY